MEELLASLRELRVERVAEEWELRGLQRVPDAVLVSAVVELLIPPRDRQSTSFQLHAPLELLARVALLPWVAPAARQQALQKIVELGVRYTHSGEAARLERSRFPSLAMARAALVDAIRAGDADGADAALVALLDGERPSATLALLRPWLVDSLGAAAHAPILVAELPRFLDRIPNVVQLLRAPLRSLLHHPAALSWHRAVPSRGATVGSDAAAALLFDRLRNAPHVQTPSHSIAPTMRSVESNQLAAELLAEPCAVVDAALAERTLARLAAASMLDEPLEHAPYGWTHALTLPQAMLRMTAGTEDERAGIAVAATYALGFRATLGQVAVRASVSLDDTPRALVERRVSLATAAAQHTDAHFAKYVVACFDAAARDSHAEGLYLGAAEKLAAFWASRGSKE